MSLSSQAVACLISPVLTGRTSGFYLLHSKWRFFKIIDIRSNTISHSISSCRNSDNSFLKLFDEIIERHTIDLHFIFQPHFLPRNTSFGYVIDFGEQGKRKLHFQQACETNFLLWQLRVRLFQAEGKIIETGVRILDNNVPLLNRIIFCIFLIIKS